MTTNRELRSNSRFAVSGILAVAMVAGLVGIGSISSADAGRSRSEKADANKRMRAVDQAEQAVVRAPQNLSTRVALGKAYIGVGRFESAADAYADAMQLGDTSSGTVLSLALAQIAIGENAEAVSLLGDYRDQIPASDLGLALALSGETARGAALLTDALRNGDDTAKVRQNLAYAYALDGRWREARVMAAQDVPADQLDSRLSDWAMRSRPEAYRQRVAGLLGVPVRTDSGQPQHLALNGAAAPALAAAAPASTTALASASQELPALDGTPSAPALASAGVQTVAANEPDQEYSVPTFVSEPVVQSVPERQTPTFSIPVRQSTARQSVAAPSVIPAVATASVALDPAKCTHLVQLGAFSSEGNARRAWTIYSRRNPELRGYRMTITQAKVNGRNFWRVAAAGLDARRAVGLCSSVKGRGGACFAYAATNAPAGAIPARPGAAAGAMRARRR